jgi:hypothetical protein
VFKEGLNNAAIAPASLRSLIQGAPSEVGAREISELPMSEVQRGTRGAKARPPRGFAQKGASAAFPGLAIE